MKTCANADASGKGCAINRGEELSRGPDAAQCVTSRSIRARVWMRLGSEVASRAWVKDSQRSGACAFSGRTISGVCVADNDYMPDGAIGRRHQVCQPGLLTRFPGGDGERVALPRVPVAAHLQPGLLAKVPAQQHPGRGRVHDQRGCGDVQGDITSPRVIRGLQQRPDSPHVSRLGLALGPVTVQEHGERRRRGVRFHRTRW